MAYSNNSDTAFSDFYKNKKSAVSKTNNIDYTEYKELDQEQSRKENSSKKRSIKVNNRINSSKKLSFWEKISLNYTQIIENINKSVFLINSVFSGLSESVFAIIILFGITFVELHRISYNLAPFESDPFQRTLLSFVIVLSIIFFETIYLKTKYDNKHKEGSREHIKYRMMQFLFMSLIVVINLYGAILPELNLLEESGVKLDTITFFESMIYDATIVIPLIGNVFLTLSLVFGSQRVTTGIVMNSLKALESMDSIALQIKESGIYDLNKITHLDSRAIYSIIKNRKHLIHEKDRVDLNDFIFYNGVTGQSSQSYANVTTLKKNIDKILKDRGKIEENKFRTNVSNVG